MRNFLATIIIEIKAEPTCFSSIQKYMFMDKGSHDNIWIAHT